MKTTKTKRILATLVSVVAIVSLFMGAFSAVAAPANEEGPERRGNDDIDLAIIIPSLPYYNTQNTTRATTAEDDPSLSCIGGQGYNSVWYQYTPATDEQVVVDSFGSSYNTVLGVWTGSRGALTGVACNDDAEDTLQSQAYFPATGGTTYFFEFVGSSEDAKGDLNVCVDKQIYGDVPLDYINRKWIHAIHYYGVTSGCGGGNYCPSIPTTRDMMAVLVLRAKFGGSYVPPPATGTMFRDVPVTFWAAAWIEELSRQGITSGCGAGNYCPTAPVAREQVAVLLLRAKHGPTYTPPPATGTMFADVPASHWAAAWIEQLVNEGIAAGCGGGNFCPSEVTNRSPMAVFLVRTFNIPFACANQSLAPASPQQEQQ